MPPTNYAGNFQGPTFMRMYYRAGGVPHVHQVSVNAVPNVLVASGWEAETRGQLTVIDFPDFALEYAQSVIGNLCRNSFIDFAELYNQPTPTDTAALVALAPINVNSPSTNLEPNTVRATYSCRTSSGAIFRPVFIGQSDSPDRVVTPIRDAGGLYTDPYLRFIFGDRSAVVGRDGNYPQVARAYITKTDDVTRRNVLNL